MEISELFKWKKRYVLRGVNDLPLVDQNGNEIIVYIRVIGDNDMDEAKKYALRHSKKLRDKYLNDSSDILPDFEEFTKEELATLILLNDASVLYKQAEQETKIPYPTGGDSNFLEDQEKYAEAIENYFEELSKAINKRVEELFQDRKQYYLSLGEKELLNKARRAYIGKIVEEEMIKIYNDAILCFAIYADEDCTERIFDNIEVARNAAPFLKEQLYSEYSKLVLSDTNLKK